VAALDRIVVIDFTHVVAGPFCTMLLGDAGADVIKVERPVRGDHVRAWPPAWNGTAAAYLALNRNKRSIALDLKHPRGRDVAYKLVERADVVVESLRPGSMAGLGLSYEDIKARNARIVYCSISGYGQTGPKASLGGYDLIAQAYGGLMSVTGEPSGPPVRAGYSVFDLFAGMAAYSAIMTALFERERTGRGQHVETSLLDAAVAQMSYHAVSYLATNKVPVALGTQSPSLVPYQLFQAADTQFIVGCNNDDTWRRLCTALNRAELAGDSRFATNADRLRNKDVLVALLAEVFRTRDAAAWVEQLNAHHVPSSRVNTVADVVHDEQVAARDLLVSIPHPTIAGLRAPAAPFRTVGTQPMPAHKPPDLGEHSEMILQQLGYSADETARLKSEGVIDRKPG
jgi:crotonobetainyl-CoA:carnitine CoA-transferase CaiB-like acyl-CoA transferase